MYNALDHERGRARPPILFELMAIADRHRSRDSFHNYVTRRLIQDQRDCRLGIHLLNTVIAIAPMAGLCGTVVGILKVFLAFAAADYAPSLGDLAPGVSTALKTTLVGITCATVGTMLSAMVPLESLLREESNVFVAAWDESRQLSSRAHQVRPATRRNRR